MPANTCVHISIDPSIKNEAAAVLATTGLTVSDICRMVLTELLMKSVYPLAWKYPMRKQ